MFALNIAQFLQKTFEIIHVWTIFFLWQRAHWLCCSSLL